MPRAPKDIPDTLRPYISNGVNLEWGEHDHEAKGDCPFCGREDKFSVNIDTGQYRCFICQDGNTKGGGNPYIFIRHLHKESLRTTNVDQYADLIRDRKLLSVEALRVWGCCRSVTTGNWIIPGYSPSGEICQIYSYVPKGGRMLMLPTATLGHQMFGLSLPLTDVVWLTEGPWDGIALWEIMSMTSMTESGLAPLSNGTSLLATNSVMSISSTGAMGDPFIKYIPMLAGKTVNLCFDNDHPHYNEKTGEPIDPSGWLATKRALMLLDCDTPPKQINFIRWGSNDIGYEGVNLELSNGYDVRDCLTETPKHSMLPRQARITALGNLFDLVQPVPATWIAEAKDHKDKEQKHELICKTCHSYEKLAVAWSQALNWTSGLDHAFPIMLACTTSTMMLGDQLWFRVLGPPGCLAGSTFIYDPTDGTKKTVEERWKESIPFHVYSRMEDGTIGIVEALQPKRYQPTLIYKVRFKSSREIRVTSRHRFWDGTQYVALRTILPTNQHHSYPIPSISETELPNKERYEEATKLTGYSITRILVKERIDTIVEVIEDGIESYYDFHVPETNNYWAEGVFNHNCGKTTLAEAIAVCKKHVKSVSTLKGMYSGAIDESGEDFSLINSAASKTLVVKDGDPLLQQPNLGQILSELRDIYDTVGRPNYRNKAKTREYLHKRMTLLLCGTASLRHLDDSELGERTLDCVVMKKIDDDLEDEVLDIIANRSAANLQVEVNGKADTHYDGALLKAMQLTGGYVEYLRERAVELIADLTISEEVKYQCTRLGKFVAHLRARPSKKQKETVQREFASRLTSQFVRLAGCLAVVLNKTTVDNEIMQRIRKVAMDTSDGTTFKIVDYLRQNPEGSALLSVASIICQSTEEAARLIQFLINIEVVEQFAMEGQVRGTRMRYRLTPRMVRMWHAVHMEV